MDTIEILIWLRRKVFFFSPRVKVDKPWAWVFEIVCLLRQIIQPPIHLSILAVNFLPDLSIFLPELINDGFLVCYKVSHNLGKVHNYLFKFWGLLWCLSGLHVLTWLWFPKEIWMIPTIWIVVVIITKYLSHHWNDRTLLHQVLKRLTDATWHTKHLPRRWKDRTLLHQVLKRLTNGTRHSLH